MIKSAVAYLRQNTIALIALCLVIGGGTAWAASKVGSNDIKPNAVKSKHIADAALRSRHFRDGAVTADAIKTGDLGSRQIGERAVGVEEIGELPRAEIFALDSQTFDSGQQSDVEAEEIEYFDSDAFQATDFPGQVEVQEPGTYEISGTVTWEANATGDRYLQIGVNQVSSGDGIEIPAATREPASAEPMVMSVSTTAVLDTGDIVALGASQTSGGQLDLTDSGENIGARLAIQYLSDSP